MIVVFATLGVSVSSEGSRLWRVGYFLNPHDDKFVMVNVGSEQGLSVGLVLNSYRFHLASEDDALPFVLTGKMKVRQLDRNTAIAEVMERGSDLSKSVFPDYPEIMAGDLLSLPTIVLSRKESVSRVLTLPFFDLFTDPQGDPQTYELSAAGHTRLAEVTAEFGPDQSGILLVKAYTDDEGSKERNQVESHQRALTIKQALVSAWQFDEERIVAIGIGERSPIEPNQIPGQEKYNRRIELKIIPFTPR